MPDDSQQSTQELRNEYCGIVHLIRRPKCIRRVRAIIDELRRRNLDAQPASKRRRRESLWSPDLTVDNPEASAHGAAAQAVSMEIEQEIGMLSARIRAQEYSASKG